MKISLNVYGIPGHGEINVRGGKAYNYGGGGSGGRIGVHCRYRYSFGGKFVNRGGEGYHSATDLTYGAAAGTAFVENNMRPLEYRILKYLPGTNYTYLQVCTALYHRCIVRFINK